MCIHPKSNRKETSVAKRAAVWTRYCSGYKVPKIVALEGLPRSTIRSIIERRVESGNSSFQSKPRSGRPKKTTARDDRALLRAANRDTKATLFALATPSKSTRQLGRNTVRKILKAAGKAKRRPRKKPFLKPEHKYWRRKWCNTEKRSKRDWDKVCWSDEVTFEVGEDGSIFYVTRGPKEECLEKNLKPSFKSGRTSVGVWSCYCGDEMGPLVIIEKGGRMTAKRYLKTLKTHFIPFYRRMVRKYGPDVVMQEDNAPWHTAKLVRAYLDKQKVKRLQWPAQSPDLLPIENLWKQIKSIIRKRRHRVRNVGMMETALAEIWPTISKDALLKLNASMPNRLNACIKNKGGSTKY
jgi:transposase